MDKKEEALRIVKEGLKELESQKGSITVAVQKLSRASNLLEEKTIIFGRKFELGNEIYIQPLQEFVNKMMEDQDAKKDISIYKDKEYQPY